MGNIPEYITAVADTLEAAGYDAYLVGGCVRDAALGKTPDDYDMTTNAKPRDMLRVFDGWRVIETGLKHGTLTVVSDGKCVEVTTYRIDGVYADNRHPTEVTFTDDITLDLSRRDFTVNAMAYSTSRGLCDPFGGMGHLAEERIVCVGDPVARFNEDGLRILRGLRFASVLDFEIDPLTADAIRDRKALLGGISKERIFVELFKLLCGRGVARITDAFGDVLELCGDGVSADAFREASDSLVSLPEKDSACRVAYLCRLEADKAGADARSLASAYCRSLKTSAAFMRRCANLAQVSGEPIPVSRSDVKRLMGRLDPLDISAYAAMRRALYGEDAASERLLADVCRLAEENPCVKVSQLALNGSDVMKIKGVRGAEVGRLLDALLDAVITERIPNTADSLARELESM